MQLFCFLLPDLRLAQMRQRGFRLLAHAPSMKQLIFNPFDALDHRRLVAIQICPGLPYSGPLLPSRIRRDICIDALLEVINSPSNLRQRLGVWAESFSQQGYKMAEAVPETKSNHGRPGASAALAELSASAGGLGRSKNG